MVWGGVLAVGLLSLPSAAQGPRLSRPQVRPLAVRVAAPLGLDRRLTLPRTALAPRLVRPALALPLPDRARPRLAAPVAAPVGLPGRLARTARHIIERVFPLRAVDLLGGVSRSPLPDGAPPASKKKPVPSYDYARMLDMTRRVLVRPAARKFLREVFAEELVISEEMRKEYKLPEDYEKVKDISENQLLVLLQYNQQLWPVIEEYLAEIEKKEDKLDEDDPKLIEAKKKWRERFREFAADEFIVESFKKLNDPLAPFHLTLENDVPGYSNAKVFANHKKMVDGQAAEADDLSQVLVDYIDGAEEEVWFNVFDFDLEKVADAFIRAAKRGVKVFGGVDGKLVDKDSDSYRPQVEAIFKKLEGTAGITLRAVDAVGLNHQKMVIRDPNNPKKAKALYSSGNFTQSCIGPEGDLVGVPAADRPKDSVPNANHMVVLDSYLLAQASLHNLHKTLVMGLRGSEYPLSGGFKIFGAKAEGAAEAPYLAVSFTPGGALGDVNRDMTRRLLLLTRGPVRLMQFAFSSEEVRQALLERARLETKEGRTFDLKTIGDTPFALRPWSVTLNLAGMELKEDGESKEYVELKTADNELRQIVGPENYEALRKNLRVGPRAYRNHHYKNGEESLEYGSKVHHKVMISGGFAVMGTSFNFSEAANSNQEQFFLTNDPGMVAAINGIFDGFFSLAGTSIVEEAERRNQFLKQGGEDDLKLEKQYEHVDRESAKSRRR